MTEIKGYTLAQFEMFINVLQDQHKQQRIAEATAARYANAEEQSWKKYIRALEK